MIAIALAAVLQLAPADHSAQCLVEVAALSGEALDITDARMRDAAVRKTDQLMIAHQNGVDALVELDKAEKDALSRMAAGELPAGSGDVIRAQVRRDRADLSSVLMHSTTFAPSCSWPIASQ